MHTRGSRAQILVMVLLIMSALMAAGLMLTRAVVSEGYMADLYLNRAKAFCLAEAGIEEAKVIIMNNPNWFTDNPHNPDGELFWVIHFSSGYVKKLGKDSYKIVRENGKNIIYSVGFTGEKMNKAKARSVISIKFDINTFKYYEFKIL